MSNFLSRIFATRPDQGIENLKAVIAANAADFEFCGSFSRRATALDAALQEASRSFYQTPNDETLEVFLQARRTHASDAAALREISAQLCQSHQQDNLEKLKECLGPALRAVQARIKSEVAEIAKRDAAEASRLGMPCEPSPARQRLLLILDEAERLEAQLPAINCGNVLSADSHLRNVVSFCLGTDNREYHARPQGTQRTVKALETD